MRDWKKAGLIFVSGLILSLGLFMNSGYFSHDEIGWGIKAISADSLSDINFYSIFHYNEFHYRPLNFNLWLITSYYLFDFPQMYHLLLVCFGLINSILVYVFLKNEVKERVAFLTAIISTIMPTIVFVNGWIGTIADIFWFMCCLVSLIIHQKNKSSVSSRYRCFLLVMSVFFFIIALMFKETAVVYPGILFIYLIYSNYKRNDNLLIYKNKYDICLFVLSTLVLIFYLIVRFHFLFPNNGGGYGTSISNIPIRILEYFIYPFLIKNTELHGLLSQSSFSELIFSSCLHFSLIVILCGKKFFKYILYFSCYFITSVPILILDMSLPHYIYASGFVIAFSLSTLFFNNNYKKFTSIILFSLIALHGVNIQRNYIFTGAYQNNFVNTLYSVIKSNEKKCIYIIKPEVGSASWIAIRAISFRQYIDDLKISNRVYFEWDDISQLVSENKCNLSLDITGRVVLVGEHNDVQ